MNFSHIKAHPAYARLKLFWALSRTPHGLIDMTTPAVAALLWLGRFPSPGIVVLGLITTFAGYTAVYALNDVVDYRSDRQKYQEGGFCDTGSDLDSVLVRHPLACGHLSLRAGVLWVLAWAAVAVCGAYLLNPVCVWIFLAGCLLEAVYCLMLRVSYIRVFITGAVKTSGAMAAVFAVDPNPSAVYLIFLFLCLFFWEIGGQNLPNDWIDMEEDRRLKAQTIPVTFGLKRTARFIMGSIGLTVVISLLLFGLSQTRFEPFYYVTVLCVTGVLLVWPAYRLYTRHDRALAMQLFNRASYFPPALLVVVLVKLISG